MVQPDGATVRLLDRLFADHPKWSEGTQRVYRSVLEMLAQQFPIPPSDPLEIISWVRGLESLYEGRILRTSTKFDYYQRIRALYRWAGLPPLPYRSFAERKWRGQPRE